MSKQTETTKPAEKSRRDQNAELYRKYNWHLWHSHSNKNGANVVTFERWIQDITGRNSIVIISNINGEQSIENFFLGGGNTWQELERALASDPVVVEFDKDDRSELYHIIQNRGQCETRKKLVGALQAIDPTLAQSLNL